MLLVERMAMRFGFRYAGSVPGLALPFVNVCSHYFCYTEFPAVGYRNNDASGTLNNTGTQGYYWSSVQNNTNEAYRMNFNSSSVGVNNNYKTNGFSVRCVRQEFTALILTHKRYLI